MEFFFSAVSSFCGSSNVRQGVNAFWILSLGRDTHSMNLAFYRYLWEFYTSDKFGWIQSVSFQVEEHPSNTPHQHLLYETDLLHNLGYNISNFNSTLCKFSFTSVFFFPIVDNEICFPLLLMYSILLSFPFTCSFIVLFLLLSMMDMLYLTPSVFGWFFFPTENDTYNPAYSIFFSVFFNTLNCYQPTCIYTHFSSTKICKSAVWRKKKSMILIRQRIELKYEGLLSVGNTAFERKWVFLPLFICFWLLRKGIMMEVLSGYSYCIWIGPFYKHLLVCLMHLNVL